MANLKLVADAIFTKKVSWEEVSDEEKETCFFINLKTIDKVTGMNLWYHFFKGKPYPNWLWIKNETKEKSEISEKDYKLLLEKLKIKDLDLNYLIDNHLEFVKEELKYYKSLQKEQ